LDLVERAPHRLAQLQGLRRRLHQPLAALEQRIIGSYEHNVRDGGHRFRAAQDARALRDVVTFHWEMLRTEGGEVVATGFEFLIVDPQGRIRIDYQFFL